MEPQSTVESPNTKSARASGFEAVELLFSSRERWRVERPTGSSRRIEMRRSCMRNADFREDIEAEAQARSLSLSPSLSLSLSLCCFEMEEAALVRAMR